MHNGTLDMEVLDNLMIGMPGVLNKIWKAEVQIYDERELGMCFFFTFEVRRVRIRE